MIKVFEAPPYEVCDSIFSMFIKLFAEKMYMRCPCETTVKNNAQDFNLFVIGNKVVVKCNMKFTFLFFYENDAT